MKAKVIAVAALAFTAVSSFAAEPLIQTLSNGVRVVVVHFPTSTNVSIFTFLPMSLCSDPAGRAQWSHLVEHLVIRSTFSNQLARANAETLPDHMRLDFYGNTADWKEGLSHHRRWLEGVAFNEATMAAEKPKVIGECDFTSRNFATHKFAVAAWAHASRHSNSHVAIKGDVLRANLEEVQRYRDSQLFVPRQTTVCVVGGVDAQAVLAEVRNQLGKLTSPARLPTAMDNVRTGRLEVTWDLDARHLLLTWPLPDFGDPDFAPLMAASQWLTMQYFNDSELKKLIGQTFAGADLVTPEGNYFFVSASLRPGAAFADVEKALRRPLSKLSDTQIDSFRLGMLGRQLSSSLTVVGDPALMMRQMPSGMTAAMVEGNIGLAFGMNVHRYGADREKLARNLAKASGAAVRGAMGRYLREGKGGVCQIKAVEGRAGSE
jgi:predicted Zn-dependent peptidase